MFNQGSLTVLDCTLTNNRAVGGNGGGYQIDANTGGARRGSERLWLAGH